MKYFASPAILSHDDPALMAWDAIAPIWPVIPYQNAKRLATFMDTLTKGQQALISIDWCQKEIRNGGFRQLFENSTGNLVPWAIEGFALVGANQFGKIVGNAAELLGPTYPMSGAARKRRLQSIDKKSKDKLAKLDDAFLRLVSSKEECFEVCRGGYVQRNAHEFVRMPDGG